MTTFLAIAENSNLEFVAFSCAAKGKLEQVDGKMMMTEVLLEPVVTIVNEKDTEKAKRVIDKSEKSCLISNSIRSTVTMSPPVVKCEPPENLKQSA